MKVSILVILLSLNVYSNLAIYVHLSYSCMSKVSTYDVDALLNLQRLCSLNSYLSAVSLVYSLDISVIDYAVIILCGAH